MEANSTSAERVETADVYSDAAIYERERERERDERERKEKKGKKESTEKYLSHPQLLIDV